MPPLWRRIFGRLDEPVQMSAPVPAARFSVDVPPEMLEAMTFGGSIEPRISRVEALSVPAVLRSRNLISGSLCTLPLRVHGPDRRVVADQTYLVGSQIDPDIPNSVVMAMTIEDLLFESVSWWRVIRRGWHGYPVEAQHVPTGSVHVAQSGTLLPSQMQISPDQPFPADGQVYIDGVPVPDSEVIRFDSPNPPLLRHAARAIRTCLLLDKTASLYARNPLPLGVFTPKEGVDPDEADVQAALDRWELSRRQQAWGYIGAALEGKVLQWSPEQLQMADARQHAVLEIARAAGIDPEDLGVSTTTRTYQNSEQRRQDLLDFTLGPFVSAVQERLSMRDVLPRGYTARIDFAGFLRSDTKTRMETYGLGLAVGAYTHDEIRELEDKPNLTSAQRAALQPPQTPQPAAQPGKAAPQMSLAETTFTAGIESTRVTFGGDDVAETFRVNAERRTVSGLAVPWGKVARSGFANWKFLPDSLHWSSDTRVKMNLDHDHTQTVGRGVRLQSTSQGLDSTFKVARGAEGDRALAYAEDGVYDGFSIEVTFDGPGDGWTQDPRDESVNLVHSATLRAVALTAMPAFDDARLTAVTASRDNQRGTTMTAPTKVAAGQPDEAFDFDGHMERLADKITESHTNLTKQLGDSIGESISAGFKAALENLPNPQEGPQAVRAARFTVTREAPVYAFNGSGHSLVRDAWYAARERDSEALERLRKYRVQTEEIGKLAAAAMFTTTSTSSASQVIPPGYRPDLYVTQLQQGRPMVNACSQGTISNATPFVVPIFSTVTGAAQDHVEGTNPTDGTLTFTTKTVTPVAIDGKLILTREIVDSSNPAIDQIALAAMRESYARQTEAKVYTLLNGANGAGGTITSGLVPSGAQAATFASTGGSPYAEAALIKGIRQQLAKYPFNRFAAPGIALMGQNATGIMATVADSTGRPLFPSTGAMNTQGNGNAITQRWNVDGLDFIPAWAMTGVAAGDSQIMILNPSDAWVWESPLLSFRYEEKSGPALIELNIFGYFATHLLRPVGLSGIRIT